MAATKKIVSADAAQASPDLATPAYWAEACKHLVKKDRVMKRLIPQFGDAALQTRRDAFTTLARSIVGQQSSVKAAQAVWERFAALSRTLSPAHVLKLKVDDMRAAGLSARKIDYLVDLALHFDNGKLHVKDWESMDDEAIIAELVAIRGIGRWTAEMFLIFNQLRADVWPVDDIGLQRAVSRHYLAGDTPTPKALRAFGQRFAPWRTVATWYLWRSLDPETVLY